MMNEFMKKVEAASMRTEVEKFEIGDTVSVSLKILEGAKERVQDFQGIVISKRGDGIREMFTVRHTVQGEGVERTFPIHSPRIVKIEVKRSGETRRAKLYFLRDRVGKATRLRERKVKEAPGAVRKKSRRQVAAAGIKAKKAAKSQQAENK